MFPTLPVETVLTCGCFKSWKSTVTVVVRNSGWERKAGLTVWVGFTAENQSSSTKDTESASTLRTVPFAVECLFDALVKRLTLAVETDNKGDSAFDTHSW